RASLRNEPKQYMRRVVDRFNLRRALADEGTVAQLRMAGFRGQAPLFIFLFARLIAPLILLAIAAIHLFFLRTFEQPPIFKFGVAIIAGFIGFYAPIIYVRNIISKRQVSVRRAWPDALDLLLICVESGMSAEAAFRKVSEEIGLQSVELAE